MKPSAQWNFINFAQSIKELSKFCKQFCLSYPHNIIFALTWFLAIIVIPWGEIQTIYICLNPLKKPTMLGNIQQFMQNSTKNPQRKEIRKYFVCIWKVSKTSSGFFSWLKWIFLGISLPYTWKTKKSTITLFSKIFKFLRIKRFSPRKNSKDSQTIPKTSGYSFDGLPFASNLQSN